MNQAKRAEQLSQFVLPEKMPEHIVIIMDGNGRWAEKKHLPRVAGHKAGLQTVRNVVTACGHWQIKALTLFAFSSENWGRPAQEVQFLMNLFYSTLIEEIETLHQNNVCLRIIGDRSSLSLELQKAIIHAETLTANNTGLNLAIAINYGGRADITHAMQQIAEKIQQGLITKEEITPELINSHIALAQLPEPDLFIRTSGEIRISNFMLWQLAYTELYFTDTVWPDFDDAALHKAICTFAKRDRRFGTIDIKTTEEHYA
ncbi:MAG: isoprenyl transferase [Gammaproteobacteria bacterium]|jgi:undecaprenyl diphosphate synthase